MIGISVKLLGFTGRNHNTHSPNQIMASVARAATVFNSIISIYA